MRPILPQDAFEDDLEPDRGRGGRASHGRTGTVHTERNIPMTCPTVLALGAMLCAGTAIADPVGHARITLEPPHRLGPVEAAIWYPAEAGPKPVAFAENAVFEGDDVLPEAAPTGVDLPVLLLSHGLGGNLRGLGWLAHGLAERGIVTLAVNHPRSSTGDTDPMGSLDHGARAADLAAALDVLLADPRFAGRIEGASVTAAGFSLGGWTALTLGGLRGNLAGYADHCAEVGDASTHCADLAEWGLDLGTLDPAAWNADHADRRVARVVALDPGLVWGLAPDAAQGAVEDVLLVGLGTGEDRLMATDFDAAGLPRLLPDARREIVAPAHHWSALPVCKPGGAAIVAEETPYPICTDPPDADRGNIHARITEAVADFVMQDVE
jgi:predicted dienelactone hydrolase